MSCLTRRHKPGQELWRSWVANRQNPPLGFTNEIQRNASNTFGISAAAGAVDKISRVTPNNFRSSIPGLLLGFAPFCHTPINATERDLPF